MSENKPLAGIKVVEWTTFVAAPVCGRIMADWGADVTKIETPDGDYWRTYGPKMELPGEDGENPLFDLTNANKKAVTLNLRTPGGKEIMEKMIAGCDVFITNSRTKVLQKLGFDFLVLPVLSDLVLREVAALCGLNIVSGEPSVIRTLRDLRRLL